MRFAPTGNVGNCHLQLNIHDHLFYDLCLNFLASELPDFFFYFNDFVKDQS